MGVAKKTTFSIGQLAKAAQVNLQTIRFYERQGILHPVFRKESGYRVYDEESLKRLHFIRQAKEMGFSLKEINSLLGLRVKSVDSCNKVRQKTTNKLKDIQKKIVQLKKLEQILKTLIRDCERRVILDRCPILEKMEL